MPQAAAHGPLSTAFLLIETLKSNGAPVWAVKWRSADGKRLRRRLGGAAWVVRGHDGHWRPRAGRPVAGQLTEFQARRRMSYLVRAVEGERERTAGLEQRQRRHSPRPRAARRSGRSRMAWLEHLADVDGAKPSTLRDYRSMFAEPGMPHRRGPGRTIGRIMAALGDMAAAEVMASHVEALLSAQANEDVGARSVNKNRQVVATIFNFGLRRENVQRWGLTGNPAVATAKRRENPSPRPPPAQTTQGGSRAASHEDPAASETTDHGRTE